MAHTWGTETILEVDGAPLGQTFAVVLLSEDGEELTSGTFVGTEQTYWTISQSFHLPLTSLLEDPTY